LNGGPRSAIIYRMAAIAGAHPQTLTGREPGWIYKRSWDLTLIIFSAVLVPLPFLMAWAAQRTGLLSLDKTVDWINIVVALLIGGPHLFSTVTYTFMDGRFRAPSRPAPDHLPD
jgi:hypothetical protein